MKIQSLPILKLDRYEFKNHVQIVVRMPESNLVRRLAMAGVPNISEYFSDLDNLSVSLEIKFD